MRRRHVALLALLSLTLLPSSASADVLSGTCSSPTLEQPFLRWLDPMSYVLAPDGGFEREANGWNLRGGADVVRGNESFYVRDADDRRALDLPAGASATSPRMCVDLTRPTVRFFARKTSGLLPLLRVDVLTSTGIDTLGLVSAGTSWQPTLPIPVLSPFEGTVAFRFTALSGDWRIDDVYVDPYAKR